MLAAERLGRNVTGCVKLSPPHHYVAIAGGQRFFACLRVQARQSVSSPWGADGDVALTFDDSVSRSEQRAGLLERERPYLRAMYSPLRGLIHIEALDKGCIVKGQRFTSSTLNQIRLLAPRATTVVLANVLHSQTRDLLLEILRAPSPGSRRLDVEPDPGPLVKGLLRAGCFNIVAAPERVGSVYINLTASC